MTAQGHGGQRPGAGRKIEGKQKKVTISVVMEPALNEKIEALAAAQGKSKSATISELLQYALNHIE